MNFIMKYDLTIFALLEVTTWAIFFGGGGVSPGAPPPPPHMPLSRNISNGIIHKVHCPLNYKEPESSKQVCIYNHTTCINDTQIFYEGCMLLSFRE